jgi:hypothetical protein
MRTRGARLGVVYEHPAWFAPLFEELDRRSIPYDRIDVTSHTFALESSDAPWTIVLNRMSPSAYLRGHGNAIVYAREFLRYLEAAGADVVNGAEALALETSKVTQALLLRRLGLRTPRTHVVNHVTQIQAAAADLAFPVAVKPNIGGSGAGIRVYGTPRDLADAVARGAVALGVDDTALVQEFLPARGGHIVRVEIVGGRFLYAIKVYPDPGGFNLCPADICRPDEIRAPAAATAEPTQGTTDLCPQDLPKVSVRVEAYTPPGDVVRDVLRIAAAARLDLAGVEYLVNDRDGRVYYYDVNALSNFVANAAALLGFNPYAMLVDYLAQRGALLAAAPV